MSKMSESEYIVWKCETLDKIREDHPLWSEKMVMKYFEKVKEIIKRDYPDFGL